MKKTNIYMYIYTEDLESNIYSTLKSNICFFRASVASNGWAQAGGEGATALGWGVVAGSEG